jgi:hypothetical protein
MLYDPKTFAIMLLPGGTSSSPPSTGEQSCTRYLRESARLDRYGAVALHAIRPFWKAVLGCAGVPGSDGGLDALRAGR